MFSSLLFIFQVRWPVLSGFSPETLLLFGTLSPLGISHLQILSIPTQKQNATLDHPTHVVICKQFTPKLLFLFAKRLVGTHPMICPCVHNDRRAKGTSWVDSTSTHGVLVNVNYYKEKQQKQG